VTCGVVGIATNSCERGSDREKFGAPEAEYKGLRVCVTGKITSYRGRAEIVATERGQIEIQT
jgi:hypothetical protein